MAFAFFVGHPRSWESPDCEIIQETKHPRGSWVSLIKSTHYSNSGDIFVGQRESRRHKTIEVVQPKIYSSFSDRVNTVVDQDFCDLWEGGFGFDTDMNAATNYFNHIMDNAHHIGILIPYKSSIARDAQRQKVYTWEHKFYSKDPNRIMDKEEVSIFVRQMEKDFKGIAPYTLKLSFRERGGCYQRGISEVNLAAYGMNRDIVIHEMAHWVVSNVHRNATNHGPEFVGMFMLMLTHYNGYCLTDMINHAIKLNVKFVFPTGGIGKYIKQLAAA